MSTPTVHQIAFSMIKGITIDIANAIIEVVGSEELFFNMSEKELSGISQINSKLFTSGYRESLLDDADKQLDFISKKGIDCQYRKLCKRKTRERCSAYGKLGHG